ncbi:MAG TPA: M14 family zinc carboxypeptidase [Vicinamibacterales bacterium]|nr:M14 family zinc carboxypeptidase [Vicinamibacterales bacterium]
MTGTPSARVLAIVLFLLAVTAPARAQQAPYARDPRQAVDAEYTKKIQEYTTAPYFSSPLVDYLPASKTVPTPAAVLGDVAGAPGRLPYSAEVHQYFRMLEKATPRVRVFSIGQSEEGREMIAAAIADASLLARMDANRQRLAKLADPRTLGLDDGKAEALVQASTPIYYITGSLHAPETGAPTALMELAYRLAVDEAPYIQAIRSKVITLITPVVEVDGRDRQVDIYKWHLAHPKDNWPPLVYWGKYVAHDNNRDAMGLTLALTRNVLDVFVDQKAQLLHDLHESVPYLYDNTVGDGPYNAWVDPILADEWQMLGWNNMSELTRFGMPGAFAHGTFDTWTPGYLMFIAAMHNGTSRLYETFGNAGADTVERTLSAREYTRTWYRQNPPLPKASWSQRNNNNYQQTGLLTALSYYAANNKLFLRNFYLKAKRSVLKPKNEGPAAYVFPADDPRPGAQAALLRLLQKQRCEIGRATAPFTVTVPARKRPARPGDETKPGAATPERGKADAARAEPSARDFPAGSYVVRMDQPYSRIADALLDYQYWSPSDPQKNPYDDTGWTFGEAFNVRVVRVTDAKVLDVPTEPVAGGIRAPGGIAGSGPFLVLNHDADPSIIAFRYRLKDVPFETAAAPIEADGRSFNRGSFILKAGDVAAVEAVAAELGLLLHALPAAPTVATHPVKTARIAYVHSWVSTQDEGWWRMEFDRLGIPYDYISTQTVAATPDLRGRYDVIVFPPVGRGGQQVVTGLPMWGNALPWKKTELTPNIGVIDSTDDLRPGLGWTGLTNLDAFVRQGGVLITTADTSELAVSHGLTQGVSAQRGQRLKAPGTLVRAKVVDARSPIAYGYAENLSVYTSNGLVFGLSNSVAGRGARPGSAEADRPTGRGTADDPDVPQGRAAAEVPDPPTAEPWEALPVTDEQMRNPINIIPVAERPRVVLRYGDARDLLVSGLLEGGADIAQRPTVIDVPREKGHVILFSNNPLWRGATQGTYGLVFNAILNFDRLGAGRTFDPR